ncbi:glycosyl-4,4'-diaponeurosporenoate acyltransferase CrtO family protein [Adhaeribacter arboris]|nr:hypothetical protein [Adhaeribacter arboris]
MFWITVAESQLHPSLHSAYFNNHAFEKSGKIYAALGVHWFRWLLVISGWEKLSQKNNPVRKTLPALQQFERATRVSEFGHSVIAIIIFALTVFVCIKYSVKEAFWLILFNVLLNIYPILVQRYNRPRLRRLVQKLQQPSVV